MFRDGHRDSVWQQLRQRGLQAFAKLLTPQALQAAAQAATVRISDSPLNACTLVWLGIASALHTAKNFASVLVLTLKVLEDYEGRTPRPRERRRGTRPRRRE